MVSKTRALVSVLALFIVVYSSGCTSFGGQATGSGQGVAIDSFESDFQKIYAGETFKLQMRMTNLGSVDAANAYPKLYNIASNTGGNNLEITCDPTCGQGFNLLAPNAERGTTGESRICIWNCKAPLNIPKGLSVNFNPSVRLYYWYATHTIKSINLVSQNELRSIQSQGKSLPSETVSTSSGPVSLDVVVNGPIRYWEGESKVTFPININIANSGGGVTCITNDIIVPIPNGLPLLTTGPLAFDYASMTAGCEKASNWNKVNLYFTPDDTSINLKCNDMGTNAVELWKGQSTTVTCTVEMPVPTASTGFVQKNLKFSIQYAYFVDSAASVEVIGK
ncbi:MAG: hypothetical protein NTU57_03910 [Candidatus Aenigmarchaeota archaeon]|nr:hypothetical protein [Candidatus Aenigmarchaeota archaeon]